MCEEQRQRQVDYVIYKKSIEDWLKALEIMNDELLTKYFRIFKE